MHATKVIKNPYMQKYKINHTEYKKPLHACVYIHTYNKKNKKDCNPESQILIKTNKKYPSAKNPPESYRIKHGHPKSITFSSWWNVYSVAENTYENNRKVKSDTQYMNFTFYSIVLSSSTEAQLYKFIIFSLSLSQRSNRVLNHDGKQFDRERPVWELIKQTRQK